MFVSQQWFQDRRILNLSDGLSGQTMRSMVFTTTMPFEMETFRMAAMSRNLQEQDATSRAHHTTRKELVELSPGNLCHAFPSWKSDSWNDRSSIQGRSLVRTCACHCNRVSATMQRFGAFYDGCNLVSFAISHGNKLIRCHFHSASSVQ